jgi:plastocyanin
MSPAGDLVNRRAWRAPRSTGLVFCLAAVVLAAGGPGTPAAVQNKAASVAVSIENYSFTPDPITIAAGTTVVWTNHDEVIHSVVSSDHLFASPDLEANQQFAFTFKKAGTYPYFCSTHPEMKGRVIVK